jgi:hypothetical protein
LPINHLLGENCGTRGRIGEVGLAQGKKVDQAPLRVRRSRRSRPLARSAKREAVWFARTEQHPQEKRWRMPVSLLKGDSALGEEKEAIA